MKPPTLKELQAQCSRWNNAYLLGQPVTVRMDSGEMRETKTRSYAEVLSGHSAVIWLEGIPGCYLLSRVTPREAA